MSQVSRVIETLPILVKGCVGKDSGVLLPKVVVPECTHCLSLKGMTLWKKQIPVVYPHSSLPGAHCCCFGSVAKIQFLLSASKVLKVLRGKVRKLVFFRLKYLFSLSQSQVFFPKIQGISCIKASIKNSKIYFPMLGCPSFLLCRHLFLSLHFLFFLFLFVCSECGQDFFCNAFILYFLV